MPRTRRQAAAEDEDKEAVELSDGSSEDEHSGSGSENSSDDESSSGSEGESSDSESESSDEESSDDSSEKNSSSEEKEEEEGEDESEEEEDDSNEEEEEEEDVSMADPAELAACEMGVVNETASPMDIIALQQMWEIPWICHFVWLFQDELGLKMIKPAELEAALCCPRSSPLFSALLTRLFLPSKKLIRSLFHTRASFPYPVLHSLLCARMNNWFSACQKRLEGEEEEEEREEVEFDELTLAEEEEAKGKKQKKRRRRRAKKGEEEEKKSKGPSLKDLYHTFRVESFFPSGKNPLASRDFHELPVQTRARILYALCEYRMLGAAFMSAIRHLEPSEARVEPIGIDSEGNLYYSFGFSDFRIYLEQPSKAEQAKGPKAMEEEEDEKEDGDDKENERKQEEEEKKEKGKKGGRKQTQQKQQKQQKQPEEKEKKAAGTAEEEEKNKKKSENAQNGSSSSSLESKTAAAAISNSSPSFRLVTSSRDELLALIQRLRKGSAK